MGEAKRLAAWIAAGGEDWGLHGYKNSGGRRASRLPGKMIVISVRLRANAFGEIERVKVDGTVKRATPRRHELRKMLRLARGHGR